MPAVGAHGGEGFHELTLKGGSISVKHFSSPVLLAFDEMALVNVTRGACVLAIPVKEAAVHLAHVQASIWEAHRARPALETVQKLPLIYRVVRIPDVALSVEPAILEVPRVRVALSTNLVRAMALEDAEFGCLAL